MIDMELVRQFLVREDLNDFEKKIRDKCINFENAYNQAVQELQSKEQEIHTLKGHLEAMVVLAFELEQDRRGSEETSQEGE